MTRTDPPRLAIALLARFLPADDALVGDLLERYTITGSRLWLWRQVLMAIVLRGFVPGNREHPLGLAEVSSLVADGRPEPLASFRADRLTATAGSSVGGLGLIALSVLVVLFFSEVWWLLLLSVAGGGTWAVMVTVVRRRTMLSRCAGSAQSILGRRGD